MPASTSAFASPIARLHYRTILQIAGFLRGHLGLSMKCRSRRTDGSRVAGHEEETLHWWVVAAAANVIIFVAYLAIAFVVFRGVHRGALWRSNPLAVATGFIFLSCGIGHGIHASHLLLPTFGATDPVTHASRIADNEWHSAPWEAITAVIGVVYWSLRGRFPAILSGPSLFEDTRERQRHALELNDSIVQGLAAAKMSFEIGHDDDGRRMLEATLARSRTIVTEMLEQGEPLRPGDVRRRTPVDVIDAVS